MQLDLSRGKKHLLLVLVLFLFGACKQSEFYEKVGLSEIQTGGPGGGFQPPGNEIDPTNPGTTTPTDPTNPGTTDPTDPPVVVTPPVVTPPVVEPPIVVVPPVVTPPVVTPPIVVVPPVVTPPVVTPPVTPEVILNDRVEKFTQNKAETMAVDILWVIDNSGSMSDEQDALGKNFGSFITQFLEQDIDFRMGITTTDGTSSKNGKMVGDSSKLTSAAAKANKTEFIKNFKNYVKVGTNGSGTEQGLLTSQTFLERYASSFLRTDAILAIVYISDEEDQSKKAVADFLKNLQSHKANKAHVKAYSIVTVKDYGNSWETKGLRYQEVSKQTAGLTSDIKNDFSSTLLDIGGQIVNLLDSFALNESPYNNAIEVYIDNVKTEKGYTFSIEQRSVKFDANSLPKEGAKIEIRYKVKANVLGAI